MSLQNVGEVVVNFCCEFQHDQNAESFKSPYQFKIAQIRPNSYELIIDKPKSTKVPGPNPLCSLPSNPFG